MEILNGMFCLSNKLHLDELKKIGYENYFIEDDEFLNYDYFQPNINTRNGNKELIVGNFQLGAILGEKIDGIKVLKEHFRLTMIEFKNGNWQKVV